MSQGAYGDVVWSTTPKEPEMHLVFFPPKRKFQNAPGDVAQSNKTMHHQHFRRHGVPGCSRPENNHKDEGKKSPVTPPPPRKHPPCIGTSHGNSSPNKGVPTSTFSCFESPNPQTSMEQNF